MMLRLSNSQFALALCLAVVTSCTSPTVSDNAISVEQLDSIVDAWHLAATNADYDGYFGRMSERSIYIGTDASERWTKEEFSAFSKPYFDKGKAWDFKKMERTWRIEQKNVVWFDETLDTWMGVCRSTGVLSIENGQWKIEHYQLSVTVPNEKIKPFIELVNEEQNDSISNK